MGTTPDPAQVAAMLNENLGPFAEAIGARFDSWTPDRIEGHVVVDERHHQPFGLVHGGVWTSIVEQFGSVAAGAAVHEQGKAVVGVTNSTDFYRPVRRGRVDIVTTPVHRGRTQHVWQVDLHNEEGKLVARGQLRAQVIDQPTD